MRALVWFQNDLRVADQSALYFASQYATDGLLAIYFITPQTWQQHDMAACKVDFILRNLQVLSVELKKLNIALLIETVATFEAIPQRLIELAQQYKIHALFYNKQYEIDEKNCQTLATKKWQQEIGKVFHYDDQLILPPGKVLNQQGKFYTVFTPFKKMWYQQFKLQANSLLPKPKKQTALITQPDNIPNKLSDFINHIDIRYWPAGEQAAFAKLNSFLQKKIDLYHQQRDYPALGNTSKLSPYLALGVISARQCLFELFKIKKLNQVSELSEGALTWINELIWREFYKHILFAFPRLSMRQPFKLNTKKIVWENNQKLFAAWQQGKTGYPFIDAAMRQLLQTGWMHNRLRMVVAMFLTKNLFIDWRWGEKFFMQHLIDGDLAANNGGWQWSASTGTDAVPYFRIFNPIRQSERFDPNGKFILQYCPELKALKNLHDPTKFTEQEIKTAGYVQPIIEHTAVKARVLQAFKQL